MKATSDAGATRVFAMHGDLVFVTKDQRRVFIKVVLDDAWIIFVSVCADLGAERIEMEGGDDHQVIRLSSALRRRRKAGRP